MSFKFELKDLLSLVWCFPNNCFYIQDPARKYPERKTAKESKTRLAILIDDLNQKLDDAKQPKKKMRKMKRKVLIQDEKVMIIMMMMSTTMDMTSY